MYFLHEFSVCIELKNQMLHFHNPTSIQKHEHHTRVKRNKDCYGEKHYRKNNAVKDFFATAASRTVKM